jgi:hypothetical protein
MPGYVENTKNSQVFNFSSSFFCFYSGFIHCNQKESLHLQCSCTILITACVDQRYIQYCRCNNHDNCIQLIMNTKNFGSRGLFIQYILAGWFLYSWIGERIITTIFFFFCIELPSRICPTCQPLCIKVPQHIWFSCPSWWIQRVSHVYDVHAFKNLSFDRHKNISSHPLMEIKLFCVLFYTENFHFFFFWQLKGAHVYFMSRTVIW